MLFLANLLWTNAFGSSFAAWRRDIIVNSPLCTVRSHWSCCILMDSKIVIEFSVLLKDALRSLLRSWALWQILSIAQIYSIRYDYLVVLQLIGADRVSVLLLLASTDTAGSCCHKLVVWITIVSNVFLMLSKHAVFCPVLSKALKWVRSLVSVAHLGAGVCT